MPQRLVEKANEYEAAPHKADSLLSAHLKRFKVPLFRPFIAESFCSYPALNMRDGTRGFLLSSFGCSLLGRCFSMIYESRVLHHCR